MPALKQILCNIEWSGTGIALPEYRTTYDDGRAETYIAVPEIPTPFSIRLKSTGWIAFGLAMFVYIDGEYQCNRNRDNLKLPDGTSSRRQTEVDFLVRQKEVFFPNGSFLGRPWKFEKLNIVSGTPQGLLRRAPYDGEYIGTIEVVVLRCLPSPETVLPSSGVIVKTSVEHRTNLEQTKKRNKKYHLKENDAEIGDLVDGTSDENLAARNGLLFGGDATWDNTDQADGGAPNEPQQWVPHMTGPNTGVYRPMDRALPVQKQQEVQRGTNGSRARGLYNPDWTQNTGPSHGPYQVPSNPLASGNPGVVINVNQGKSDAPIWGRSPAGPAQSVADSGATRKARHETSEQINEQQQYSMNSSGGNHGLTPEWQQRLGGQRSVSGHGFENYAEGNWQTNEVATKQQNACPFNTSRDSQPRGFDDYNQHQQDQSGLNKDDNHGHDSRWDNSTDKPEGCLEQHDETGGNHDSSQAHDWDTQNTDQGHNSDCKHPKTPQNWNAQVNGKQNQANSVTNGANAHATGLGGAQSNKQYTSALAPNNGADRHTHGRVGAQQNGEAWNASGQAGNSQFGGGKLNPPLPTCQQRNLMGGGPSQPTIPLVSMHENLVASTMPLHGVLDQPTMNNSMVNSPQTVTSAVPSDCWLSPSSPHIKPYWSTWEKSHKSRNDEGNTGVVPNSAQTGPEEALYMVTEDVAQRKRLSHQVQTGKPMVYAHKTASPKYMDSHDNPYAVFLFKYRSQALLQTHLNITVIEPEIDEKQRLKDLSKDEIIDQFLQIKASTVQAQQSYSSARNPATDSWPAPQHTEPLVRPWATAPANQPAVGIGIELGELNEKLGNLQVNSNRDNNSPNAEHLWGRNVYSPGRQNQDHGSNQYNAGVLGIGASTNGLKSSLNSQPRDAASGNVAWGNQNQTGIRAIGGHGGGSNRGVNLANVGQPDTKHWAGGVGNRNGGAPGPNNSITGPASRDDTWNRTGAEGQQEQPVEW